MTLYEAPDPHLIIKPKTKLALVAHRQAALTNPVYFFRYVLGNDIKACLNFLKCTNEEHFHGEWIRNFALYQASYAISARGHIKSTIAQGLAAWMMCGGKFPHWTKWLKDIFMVTYSGDQATEWLTNVSIMIDDFLVLNLQLDMEYRKKSLSKDIQLINKGRCSARGLTGTIRMRHSDILFIDDIISEKMKVTMAEAERILRGSIIGTMLPHTLLFFIGTILEEGDPVDKVHNGEIGKHTFKTGKKYPALFDEIDMFKIDINDPDTWKDIRVRWPEKRNFEFLYRQWDYQGEIIFQIEYMLNPLSDEMSLVKNDMIDEAKERGKGLVLDRKPQQHAICTAGFDPQISPSVDADWSVVFSLEILEDKIIPIGMDRFQGLDEDEQLDRIEEEDRKFRYEDLVIETVGFQRIFANLLRKRNTSIPITEHSTNIDKHDKQIGIPSIRQYFVDGTFVIPWPEGDTPQEVMTREKMSIFLRELKGIQYSVEKKQFVSKTRYDDTVLACWHALLSEQNVRGSEATMIAVD